MRVCTGGHRRKVRLSIGNGIACGRIGIGMILRWLRAFELELPVPKLGWQITDISKYHQRNTSNANESFQFLGSTYVPRSVSQHPSWTAVSEKSGSTPARSARSATPTLVRRHPNALELDRGKRANMRGNVFRPDYP